jgi:hypothetical protein
MVDVAETPENAACPFTGIVRHVAKNIKSPRIRYLEFFTSMNNA